MTKTVVLIVVAFVGFIVAYDYVSKCTLAEIEAGLPGGGQQKFADYKNNPVKSFFDQWGGSSDGEVGEVSENPFAD